MELAAAFGLSREKSRWKGVQKGVGEREQATSQSVLAVMQMTKTQRFQDSGAPESPADVREREPLGRRRLSVREAASLLGGKLSPNEE